MSFFERQGQLVKQRRASYQRKRRRQKRIFLFTLCLALTLTFLVGIRLMFSILEASDTASSYLIKDKINRNLQVDISRKSVDLSELYSPYAIALDLDTGQILGAAREQERMYPASLTKMMTAVLVIENMEDIDQMITLPADIYEELTIQDATMAGFLPGEKASARDLLYGMLLPSGAECCIALAREIAGSEAGFVDMMNQKAAALGMENTHFGNTTGLHEDDHYSTVKDISVLLQYALKNDLFREVFTSASYHTQPTDQHPYGFTLFSTLFYYIDGTELDQGAIIGGKTGYTNEAGLCLASLARINGHEYILVTADAMEAYDGVPYYILDAVNVYHQIEQADN